MTQSKLKTMILARISSTNLVKQHTDVRVNVRSDYWTIKMIKNTTLHYTTPHYITLHETIVCSTISLKMMSEYCTIKENTHVLEVCSMTRRKRWTK